AAAREKEPRSLPEHHVAPWRQHDGPRDHRRRHGDRRGGRARPGGVAREYRRDGPRLPAGRPDARRRGVPAAPRAAHAAPRRHARDRRRARHPRHSGRAAGGHRARARRRGGNAPAHGDLRGREVRVSWRAAHRARRRRLPRRRRRARGVRGPARQRAGYRTVVGERGVRLSGGQRQRIAIARALLRDAPILVLDEALSSVDAESEALIQSALDRLMEGRTTLIAAHRLSSVIGADRVMVLDRGRVAESGTHAELMARRGPYWRLMSPQVESAARPDLVIAVDGRRAESDPAETDGTGSPSTDRSAVRAAEVGWLQALPILSRLIRGYRARLVTTFVLGIARVAAIIAVGVLSALVVRAVTHGAPFGALLIALAVTAPLAGLLHWLESWLAHDMAYRLLNDMRLALFRKLDALSPAYLTR